MRPVKGTVTDSAALEAAYRDDLTRRGQRYEPKTDPIPVPLLRPPRTSTAPNADRIAELEAKVADLEGAAQANLKHIVKLETKFENLRASVQWLLDEQRKSSSNPS
jgi:hypothetical protein